MLQFLKKYKDYYDLVITIEQYTNIVYYSNKNWFIPIIKQYGLIFLLVLLEYYTSIEDYVKCSKIVESIKDSNKYWGTNYVLKLEDYDMS